MSSDKNLALTEQLQESISTSSYALPKETFPGMIPTVVIKIKNLIIAGGKNKILNVFSESPES